MPGIAGEMNNDTLRHRETTGAIIIDRFGRFLLQQRDNLVGITNPGKIGLFGGHREGEETFLECVVREVHEETGYFIPAEGFEHLGSFEGADIDIAGGTLQGHLFVVRGVPAEALAVTEGTLLIVEPNNIGDVAPKLGATARLALEAYLGLRNDGIPIKLLADDLTKKSG